MADALYVGNDNQIAVTGVADAQTGTAISNATVTAALKTTAGVAVSGADSITLSAGSTAGSYYGTIPDDVTLTAGTKYVLWVTIDAGAGKKAIVRIHLTAEHREA